MLSMRHVQQPCGTHSSSSRYQPCVGHVQQPCETHSFSSRYKPFVGHVLQPFGAHSSSSRYQYCVGHVQQPCGTLLPVTVTTAALRGARHEVPCRHLMRKAIPEAVSSLSCGMHIADMRCQAGMKKKHDLPVMYNDYPQ